MSFLWSIHVGPLLSFDIWKIGLGPGCLHLFTVLVVAVVLLRPGIPLRLDVEEVLSGFGDTDVHVF